MSIIISNENVQLKLQSLANQLTAFFDRWDELAKPNNPEAERFVENISQGRFAQPLTRAYCSEIHAAYAIYGDWVGVGNLEGSFYVFFNKDGVWKAYEGYDYIRVRFAGGKFIENNGYKMEYSRANDSLVFYPTRLNGLRIKSIDAAVSVEDFDGIESVIDLSVLFEQIERMSTGLRLAQSIMDELAPAGAAV